MKIHSSLSLLYIIIISLFHISMIVLAWQHITESCSTISCTFLMRYDSCKETYLVTRPWQSSSSSRGSYEILPPFISLHCKLITEVIVFEEFFLFLLLLFLLKRIVNRLCSHREIIFTFKFITYGMYCLQLESS